MDNPTGPEITKKIMFSSAEREILNAHKYKNIKKNQHFAGSDKHRILFFCS